MVLAKILLVLYLVKRQKPSYFYKTRTIKNAKITKRSHANRGHASTDNVEISHLLYPELQLKDNESVIRNKLKDLLNELRGFKFVTTLVLKFKKIESDDETKNSTYYSFLKADTVISDIDDVF